MVPRLETQPDGSARIHFAAPILFHAEPKGSITLRKPGVLEILQHGDPVTFVVDQGASMRVVDRPSLVAWARRLIVDHDLDMVGRSTDLQLAEMIEEAITGFFVIGRTTFAAPSAPSSNAVSPSAT